MPARLAGCRAGRWRTRWRSGTPAPGGVVVVVEELGLVGGMSTLTGRSFV
jgi:hypothetical protein